MSLKGLVVAAGCVAALVAGCSGTYESDFQVIVVNRTVNSITALANGSAVGEIAPGQSQSYTIKLPESNANIYSNGTAPTPQARAIFTAKDAKTGALSSEKSLTLSQSEPTYVPFTIDDFPSTGPTIARFTFSPTAATLNQDITFNASSSSVNNGVANGTFAWDFGDGTTGTGVTMTKRYTRGGTMTVTLTATSNNGQTSTSSRAINIATALPPTAATFTFSPANPAINQDVVFTVSGTALPGGPGGGFPGGQGPGAPAPTQGTSYAWDFGDGTTGTGSTLTHRYLRGGTFAVTLRVTSDTGLTAQTSRQLTILTTLPAGSGNFVFSPTDPHPGDTVFFNATVSTIVDGTFTWDFGDGTTGSGITTTHVYSNERTYTVTMTVRNSLGQASTTSKVITIFEPPAVP